MQMNTALILPFPIHGELALKLGTTTPCVIAGVEMEHTFGLNWTCKTSRGTLTKWLESVMNFMGNKPLKGQNDAT